MNNVRVVLALSLAVLVGVGSGCSSKTAKAPPSPEPAPVSGDSSPGNGEAAPATPGPASVDFQSAYFAVDSHELSSAARAALDQNVQVLLAHPRLDITIEGHCDERGTVEYNLALGERRARAARDYLARSGIDSSRMNVLSLGEERPFQEGHTESAWATNRRAHFVAR